MTSSGRIAARAGRACRRWGAALQPFRSAKGRVPNQQGTSEDARLPSTGLLQIPLVGFARQKSSEVSQFLPRTRAHSTAREQVSL